MANWLTKHWKYSVATVLAAVTTVAIATWPTTDRQLLFEYKFDSRTYLEKHAQPWLVAPSAASTTCRWKMTESSGNVTDDLCGNTALTANGSPKYQLYTPIPQTGGFTRKAIGFVGSEWFAAANNTVADQTTNNFSANLWFCIWTTPAANAYLVSKRTGNTGYGIYLSTTNVLTVETGDGTLTTGAVSSALTYGCHFATVTWTRAGNATAWVDGSDTATVVDISARSGSVTSATPFTIGRLSSGGNAFTGSIAEVMVSNAVTTPYEHALQYKAFLTVQPYQYTYAWPKPSAASTAWRWSMQDTSASIVDDLSGSSVALTVNGSPLFYQWSSLPHGRQVVDNWKAIQFTASGQYFSTSDSSIADFGTGSFTIAGWFRTDRTSAKMLVAKGACAGGTGCFKLYQTAANVLTLYLQDPAGHTITATVAPAMSNHIWYHVVVTVNRTTNTVMAYINGVHASSGITSIATLTGSISNTEMLTIGSVGTDVYYGYMAGVLLANGVMTVSEVRAHYQAYSSLPISCFVTTARKFPLPPDATGERLGVYGLYQWAVMYHSSLVRTTGTTYNNDNNPLGLGVPNWSSITNVIGYPSQFDQWTAGGAAAPVVVANAFESPDGSWTADQVTFGNNTSTLTKAVVGGGNTTAKARWYGSLYYKYISGTSCDIRLYNGTTRYTTLGTQTTWARASVYARDVVEAKQLVLSRNAGTSCVYAFSDAQYQQYRLSPPCTSGVTDANVSCSAQTFSVVPPSILNFGTGVLGSNLDRAEIESTFVFDPTWSGTTSGGSGTSTLSPFYGIMPTYANPSSRLGFSSNSPIESSGIGKPMGPIAELRTIRIQMDLRNGITNTTPRNYFQTITNGERDITLVNPRSLTETGQLPYTPLPYSWTNGGVVRLSGGSQNLVESLRWYTRPSMIVYPESTKHVITVDTSNAAYLKNSSISRFECPPGLDTTNCFIWDHNEFGKAGTTNAGISNLYDRINGVEATAAGNTPANHVIGVNSGLIGRGQSRRAVRFQRSAPDSLKGNSLAIASVAGLSGITLEVLYNPTKLATWTSVVDSTKAGTLGGIGVIHEEAGTTTCYICSSTGNCSYRSLLHVITTSTWYHIACVFTKTPVTNIWTVATYLNGTLTTSGSATNKAVGDIYHGEPFTIGGSTYGGSSCVDGVIGEVAIDNTALTATQVANHYKQTTQQGTFWTGSFVGHWPMWDYSYSNTSSILAAEDISGNGNHLTAATGTPPTVSYADMPYPSGTGIGKPSIGVKGTLAWWVTNGDAGAIAPSSSQSFSFASWVRCGPIPGGVVVIEKAGTNPLYRLNIDTSGRLNCTITDSSGNTSTSQNATNLCDSNWHLVACKTTWNGTNYVMTSSINGSSFNNSGTAITGTVSGNTGGVYFNYSNNASDRLMTAGTVIFKNYAMTDAYVASYANRLGADPTGGLLTYSRAATEGVCYITDVHRLTGTVVTCFGDNKFPYSFESAYATNKLNSSNATAFGRPGIGLPVYRDTNNFIQYSEAINSWSLTNTTVTADDIPAPSGAITADKVIQTVANAIHSVDTASFAVAENSTTSWSAFYRQGSASDYIKMYVNEAGGSRIWYNMRMDGTVGLSGTSGVGLAIATAPSYYGGTTTAIASSTMWNRIIGSVTCVKVGGCTVTFGVCFETGNTNSATCPTFAGAITTYMYLWGAQSSVHANAYSPLATTSYCPNKTSAASTTCSAPTTLYVSSANTNLAAWDRSSGIVYHSASNSNTTTSTNWSLSNGVNNNGLIRFASSADSTPSGLLIYNASGNLQQNPVGTTGGDTYSLITDYFAVWDSTATVYDTHRSYCIAQNLSSSYGDWDTWSTDTAANWTPAAGTNLWIGIDSTGEASAIHGIHYLTSVWKR